MGVNIKQAKYAGPEGFGITTAPPVPDSGKSQPVLDTSSKYDNPHINWGGHKEDPYLPTCAEIPTSSTDVENPEARASNGTPKDIYKGGTGNG